MYPPVQLLYANKIIQENILLNIQNGILFSHRKVRNPVTCSNMTRLEDIILSEIIQIQKNIIHIFSNKWKLQIVLPIMVSRGFEEMGTWLYEERMVNRS
jgi:hypothetical protein